MKRSCGALFLAVAMLLINGCATKNPAPINTSGAWGSRAPDAQELVNILGDAQFDAGYIGETWFQFDSGTNTLPPESQKFIRKLGGNLANAWNSDLRMESVMLVVEGLTDATGNTDWNFVLSQQRAEHVCKLLVEGGVSPSRIVARGIGSMEAKVGATADEQRAERVVELHLVSIRSQISRR